MLEVFQLLRAYLASNHVRIRRTGGGFEWGTSRPTTHGHVYELVICVTRAGGGRQGRYLKNRYLISLIRVNIGKYIARTIAPIIAPITTINMGSIIEVRVSTLVSTSMS